MDTKERLLNFIAYKKISRRKFCAACSLSHTIFNMNKSILSDKLERINGVYPELNMDWVITGKGEMIRKVEEPDPYPLEYEEVNNILSDPNLSESIEYYREKVKMLEYTVELQRLLLNDKKKKPRKKDKEVAEEEQS
jgi:hypothetical protein